MKLQLFTFVALAACILSGTPAASAFAEEEPASTDPESTRAAGATNHIANNKTAFKARPAVPDLAKVLSLVSHDGWTAEPPTVLSVSQTPLSNGVATPGSAVNSASLTNGVATNSAPTSAVNNAPPSPGVPTNTSTAASSLGSGSDQWLRVASSGLDENTAQILSEFRCKQLIRQTFKRGQRWINVEIFSFSTTDGAYAAYNLLRRGATTYIKRGDLSSEDDQTVSFWQGGYCVRVHATSEDDDESKAQVVAIADELLRAIPAHASMPSVITSLPGIDLVRGSEKLIMGPISARRFFPVPYIGSLPFNNSIVAASADYQYKEPPERLKLLCVQYKDASSAQSAQSAYVLALAEQKHRQVDSGDAGNGAMFKIGSSYMLCQTLGDRMLIVAGARHRSSPSMLSRQFYYGRFQ